MKLRTIHCAFAVSLFALQGCGSDGSGGDDYGTGGYGGLGGAGGLGSGGLLGTGGLVGNGGISTGGIGTGGTGTGGTSNTGGTPSTGGAATGGTGTGGVSTGGTAGAGGTAGTGGTGTGGTAGTGGIGTGGNLTDGGPDGSDAGPDASTEPDASMDSGTTEPDAAPDARTPDAGSDADAGPVVNCNGTTTLDVTKGGSVSANSTANLPANMWIATRAVDGSATTAWFAAVGADATFTWQATRDDCITQIDTTNTSQIGGLQKNWGFNSVIVRVFSAEGAQVFTKTVSTTGNPHPGIVVDTAGVVGRRVTLAFSGLPNGQLAGGIAELNVKAKR